MDFLLVIIELFSLAVTPVELRANIDWKAPFPKKTDGQTLIGKTTLHTMQRGKNGRKIEAY